MPDKIDAGQKEKGAKEKKCQQRSPEEKTNYSGGVKIYSRYYFFSLLDLIFRLFGRVENLISRSLTTRYFFCFVLTVLCRNALNTSYLQS